MKVKKIKNIHKLLNDSGYLCDEQFASKVASCLVTKPTSGAFLFGPAGTGKSFLPEVLADIFKADYVFYQCFPGTREDDMLIKMLPDEQTKSGIKLFDGPILEAIHLSNNGGNPLKNPPVILILDEWDKTRPSADSFLLDFLQNGRVTFNGKQHVANMDRLSVFVTMNDERDLSEPLLRRMPLILFEHLEPQLVYRALQQTHPEHDYLNNAVILYERCVMASMGKPATIQELRQLLDAITLLGKHADWDTLVFQYITKTKENHIQLKLVEDDPVSFSGGQAEAKKKKQKKKEEALESDAYSMEEEEFEGLEKNGSSNGFAKAMPPMIHVRNIQVEWEGKAPTPDEQTYGILRRGSLEYDKLVHLVSAPNEHPGDLGVEGSDAILANVGEHDIRLIKPILLTDWFRANDLFSADGEVMFVEPNATFSDVKHLAKTSTLEITKYSISEIIAKDIGIHLRCTPDQGAEIIVDLNHFPQFQAVFGAGFYEHEDEFDANKWISGNPDVPDLVNSVTVKPNEYGLMFRRRHLQGLEGLNKSYVKNRYDIWGDGWDSVPDEKVPLMDEFLQEDYHVLRGQNPNERFFQVGNLIFGFFGKNNDLFGIKILGTFDTRYWKYVQAWVPEEGLTFDLQEHVEVNENHLIKNMGFTPSTESKRLYEKTCDSGLEVTYDIKHHILMMNKIIPKKGKGKMTYSRVIAVIEDIESTWKGVYNEAN